MVLFTLCQNVDFSIRPPRSKIIFEINACSFWTRYWGKRGKDDQQEKSEIGLDKAVDHKQSMSLLVMYFYAMEL